MTRVESRLRIEADGTITAWSGKMEFGQGLRASYPRIVAEELAVDPSRVHVIFGETDVVPWDMGTFGSMSIEVDGAELRRAAAFARHTLLARAIARFGGSPAELAIADGAVIHTPSASTVSFAQLVGETPITGEIPDDVALASPAPTLVDAPAGADAIGIVTGRTQFVGDVRLPGMLHGRVLHPALHGAKLRSVARDRALAQPGVVAVIVDGNFVGVVAERADQALHAAHALEPVWDPAPIVESASLDVTMRGDPGLDLAFAGAAKRVTARYSTPHLASSPIGPSVGVADLRANDAFVYGTTQSPFGLRDDVAMIAGLTPDRVHFLPMAMSGGYGRHGSSDAALEAARLSKAVARPVMVQWGRADELHGAPHRPQMTAMLDAALDASGQIVGWRSDFQTSSYAYAGGARSAAAAAHRGAWNPIEMMTMMAGRNALPSYDVGAGEVRLHITPAKVRTGALRSLGASPNIFAIESFVDELAATAGVDPIEYRLRHVTDPRLRRVLEAVREHSGWARRVRTPGRALGVACVRYRATYVAEVAEVTVGADGTPRLEQVWCAIDAGHIVHLDGARNQVEGAVQMGASWTLIEELANRDGEVLAATWGDYPIATCLDAPRAIDIVFVGNDATPSAGLGEPPAVPIGPAIANAVFAACGARVRRLPIRRAEVLEARSSSVAG